MGNLDYNTIWGIWIITDVTGQCHLDAYKDSTITSAGTEITPTNRVIGSTQTSAMHVEYGGTYAAGDLITQRVIAGGSGNFATGGNVACATFKILEGHLLHLKITNKSQSSEDISASFVWWEE